VNRAAGLVFVTCGANPPAHATEWFVYNAPDGAEHFNALALVSSDSLTVFGAIVGAGDKDWSTQPVYGPGTPITLGQAFQDAQTIRVDVMDEKMEAKVAELRIFKAREGDGDMAMGGTMRIIGVGAWPVSCTGQ
jgi:hypothetical protein